MKIRYNIPFLVLVLVFGFGLDSCGIDSNESKIFDLENEIIDKNIEIESLESELEITKTELQQAQQLLKIYKTLPLKQQSQKLLQTTKTMTLLEAVKPLNIQRLLMEPV